MDYEDFDFEGHDEDYYGDDFYDDDESDYTYDEPDLDFQFEFDSQMDSIGWGDDDAYGYAGDEGW